ncbi:MAG: hypothetical protein CMJ78_01355, partial [Planctomycetaceae bacterium]|nr:hypothetical protein [Planctomycetaceae bacterium]
MSGETPETSRDSSLNDSTGPKPNPDGPAAESSTPDQTLESGTDGTAHNIAAGATVPPGADSLGEFTQLSDEATLPPRATGPTPAVESTFSDTPAHADQDDDATLPPRADADVPGRDVDTIVSAAPGEPGGDDTTGMHVQYFGEYELLQEIARGGMGVVYKARQSRLNRTVALKMILSGQLASQDDVQRFYIEAEAAASLEHPGIVPIYEIGEHEGQHFFSMGFIDGAGLDVQVKDGPMPPREAAAITQQVCEAIAYAHSQNVIHRDLKPANVLIDGTGQAKVTDFGLAKKTDADSGLTGTGQILGTPGYMPPEQASGETDTIGPAADIYSLGAILYALLTGRPPFQSANVMDTLVAVLEQEPVSPRQLNPALDQDLETICLKCLEKDAGRRYATTDELVAELGRYLNGEPIHARPIGKLERGWRWCKRKPALAGLGGLAVLLLLTLGIGGPLVALQQSALRTEAVTAQNDAERQRQKAARERQVAVSAEKKSEVERRKAVASREQTEATLARSNYFLAQARWDNNRVADARELLQRVPQRHRNIEWYLARWQFQGSDVALYGHTGSVLSVSFSPDGTRIASGSRDNTIRLWDALTGEELHTLKGHTDEVLSVSFSPDGTRIASGSDDNTIRSWDASTGEELHTLKGHTHDVLSVSFSPDGTRIASGSWDNTIRMWDASTGEELHTLKGHTGSVFSVSFSPDGTRIASGSDDNTIRLWDASTGEEPHNLKGHTYGVSSVSFSPDGNRIASGSYEQTVKMW